MFKKQESSNTETPKYHMLNHVVYDFKSLGDSSTHSYLLKRYTFTFPFINERSTGARRKTIEHYEGINTIHGS